MKELNPTNGFSVHAWMVTELGLGGFDLIAYAIVHQFTQSEAGIYTGGVPYLAQWLRCSHNTARNHLHNLEEKGLIKATRGTINGVPYCNYQIIENQIPKIFRDTPQKIGDDTSNFGVPTPKNLEVDNNIDNKKKSKLSPFIPPTPQDVSSYARQRGFIDPDGFAFHFCDYYSNGDTPWHLANGKPMKDWKRAVITWEPSSKERKFHSPTFIAKRITKDAFLNSFDK